MAGLAAALDATRGVDPRQLLTSKQAAAFLAISVYTLNEYVRKGLIAPTQLEGEKARRFTLASLYDFIDSRTRRD